MMCSGEFEEKFKELPGVMNQTHNTTISGNNFMTIMSPDRSRSHSHKKSKKYLSPPKHQRKNIRKCLNKIFSPSKNVNILQAKEIKELKKANFILKKKLLQITKYSKQRLTKVKKQLDKTRETM